MRSNPVAAREWSEFVKAYGGGRSTGLEQTAAGKIITGLVAEDIKVSQADRVVLIRLAERVAAISQSPHMSEKRLLWRQKNTLQKTRPVIFCDPENGWNEVVTEAQMQCQGKLARRWEMDLRKEIFWGEEMGDDKVVESFFDVPYTVLPDDWGLPTIYHQSDMPDGARSWDAPVQNYEKDLRRLCLPTIEIDWAVTNGSLALAQDLFAGILTVRLRGVWWWSLGLTVTAIMLRGMTNLLMDFVDEPENVNELLSMISRAQLKKLDYLEKHGLLSLNNDGTYIGSGGFGFTDELPQPDFTGQVRCADLWGFAESQETVHVSPEMYEKFIFTFEKPILDRFGLNCYGCCEPLDSRWQIVKNHRHLRRVSCSPWANLEKMAANLENNYIFSMKPNPAVLSVAKIDTNAIRQELRRAFAITKDCIVEVIMKDNHTVAHRPENLIEWCQIAKDEAERFF
jgi:hypothetical protein